MKPTKIQDLFDNPEIEEHDDEDAAYLKESVSENDEDKDEEDTESEDYDE